MEDVGHAVHGFLAADRPGLTDAERRALAAQLLAAYHVPGCLEPADIVAAGTRCWAWCAARYPDARLHREWPIARRTPEGTVIAGTADLVLSTRASFVLVDHKSFPGAGAAARALTYAGQLDAYARGIAAATGLAHAGSWIHFPVLGQLVEVRV
jgi:hypothetical protein